MKLLTVRGKPPNCRNERGMGRAGKSGLCC